jgi:hypothetical protein
MTPAWAAVGLCQRIVAPPAGWVDREDLSTQRPDDTVSFLNEGLRYRAIPIR